MSTRSILALQKGNRVRYCYVHWDGDNHGKTLRTMSDAEIEDLFNKMAPLDEGKKVYLEHLYNTPYWYTYMASVANRGVDQDTISRVYMGIASTPYDPLPAKNESFGPDECGSFETTSSFDQQKPTEDEPEEAARTVKELLNGNTPGHDRVWYYNLDTAKLIFFKDKYCSGTRCGWTRRESVRKSRKTPKKYKLSDFYA